MKKTISRVVALVVALVMGIGTLNISALAYSEHPEYFDFGDVVLSIKAGGVKEVSLYSKYNYTYYLGEHTSKQTFCEFTGRAGTQKLKFHIGADETVKNVFFYFYVDDEQVPDKGIYDTIEVYVQNINPVLASQNAAAEQLKSYSGNTAEFNAYYYYANYADLRAAFGTNGDALLKHYNTFGKSEKRVANKIK